MFGPQPATPPDASGEERSRPLWTALSARAGLLERLLVRMGQGVGVVCLCLATFVTLVLDAPMGPSLIGFSVVWTGLYTAVVWFWDHPMAVALRRWGLPVIEAVTPAVILWIMNRMQGPEYALGSWAPPQLACLFILGSVVRLRVELPALMGTVAALAFAGVYVLEIFPGIDPENLLQGPGMQLTRTVSLAMVGVFGSGAVRALRYNILSADQQVRAQELFGKYRLGPDIASGGMGRVVLATYAPEGGFERQVAIKLVHPHLANQADFVERFRLEAELCSRLHHPGIVAALDFGKAKDTWFFAMEYVDGRPLADIMKDHRLARRPIPPRLVVALGLQVADALEHAHSVAADPAGNALRILHRDLTPSNILLDRSGQFKISDFGVARAIGATGSLHTQHLVGKPSYVCPEALRNQPIDERADLWSLAVLLFEAVSNRRLFKRDAESATLLAVLEDPAPPLDTLRPGLGVAWQLFFDRALNKNQHERFRDAHTFAVALLELQAIEGRATPSELSHLLAFGEEELQLDESTEFGSDTVAPPRVSHNREE